ncbi:MAG: Rieske (2Fe-2S) protein [Pseudomonadales bacterium]|nr:Rieske (2Fe-2S) protein [Pseudomonadales bacterium]
MSVLCNLSDIEDESAKGFDFDSHQLVAVKKGGQVYVYVNSCPHIGIPLEFKQDQFLDLENKFIQCANHGALFEIETGDCISGPCSGQTLRAVATEIRDQQVVIVGDIPERF